MSAPRNKTRNGRVIRGIAAAVTVLPLLALLPQYATAQVNVSVSPRAYLTSITAGDFSEPAVYVTGGLSLTFGPANGSWDITLNALSGSGDSDFTELAEVAFGQAGDWEADRTDYEIMWRYRLEDSPVYVGVGLREVEFIGTFTGDISGEVEVETTEPPWENSSWGFRHKPPRAAVMHGSRISCSGTGISITAVSNRVSRPWKTTVLH